MTSEPRAKPERRRESGAHAVSLPRLPRPFSLTWRDGAFCHWPIDPDHLQPHVPEPLEVDTYDGRAWVSILPFVLARAGLRGTPAIARRTIPELNCRTYVRYGGRSGLYFFNIDLDSRAIASLVRRTTGVPCYYARQRVEGTDDEISFWSDRYASEPATKSARFVATYSPTGPVFRPDPDSLVEWLTERRAFFSINRGQVLVGTVEHDPWPLREATVEIASNTVFEAADLPEPEGQLRSYFCDRLTMTGSVIRSLGSIE